MNDQRMRVLLVTPDAELTEMFVAALVSRFDAHITCVADALEAVDADLTLPHDVILADMDLGDFSGVQFAQQLLSMGTRPVLLFGDDPLTEDVIEALRLGVRDVLSKPFPMEQLLDAVDAALRGAKQNMAHATRYRSMRDLVRRVIRERRDLNKRIDLLCRDLVGAQRRLVQRVMAMEQSQTGGA